MPRFSVIMTSYNRPKMVLEAIESVKAQTFADFELLIMDDQSARPTTRALYEHKRRDERIMVWHVVEDRKVCRYASLINNGLAAAKGAIVTYLADDDLYLPRRLDLMAERFEDPDVMVCYGRQEVQQWTGNSWEFLKVRPNRGVTSTPANLIDHCSFAHRAECLKKLDRPYWPEEEEFWGCADGAFMSKLAEHWPFHPIDAVTDVHRWHPNNVQTRLKAGKTPFYMEEM